MKIKEIVNALEKFAPLPLQDSYDHAGLQIGLTEVEVTGALLCLDVTEAVVDEAMACGCNLIVAHHPLLFRPLKALTGTTAVERIAMKAIRHGVTLYAAHTNLDNAHGGVNFEIARRLGLTHVRTLKPLRGQLLKLVTYVPEADVERVEEALFDAGCGHIGNYDRCDFKVAGAGTFRPLAGTHPYVGELGVQHEEKEVRIETILPAYRRGEVGERLVSAHPYEEPAFDFFPIENEWATVGAGIVGQLSEPAQPLEVLQRIKTTFDVHTLHHTTLPDRPIRRIAVCGGAGSFLMPEALRAGADLFLTGEVKYHDYFEYDGKLLVAAIGHYESEQYTIDLLHRLLHTRYPDLKLVKTTINTNPINYL